MIRILLQRLLLVSIVSLLASSCGGGGGGDSSSVKVIIRGTIDSLAGPGGTVTIISGNTTSTAPVGTDGKFSATLDTPDPQAFVAIRAVGTGDRSRAEFESLLGSAQSVANAAGSDGTLTTADTAKVDMNSYLTAIAAILRKIGRGSGKAATISVPDLSDAQLAAMESQVDPAQALTLGAALELGVKNLAVDFPTGFETTLEVALNDQVSSDYVQTQVTQNAEAFQQAVADLAQIAGQSIGFTVQNVPSLAHFATTSSITSQDADEFRFNTDGSGTYDALWAAEGTIDNETPFTWTVQNGTLAITLNPPLVANVTSTTDANGNFVQTNCTETLTAISLQPLAVTSSGTSVIASYTSSQSCPSRADLTGLTDFTRLGQFVPSSAFIAYTASELTSHPHTVDVPTPGRAAGGAGAVTQLDSDVLTFNGDGTGSTQISKQAFAWSIVGGELRVAYASAGSAVYRKLFAIGDGSQFRVAAVVTQPDGTLFPTASSSSTVAGVTFTSPPGDYHQNGVGSEGCVGQINEFVIRVEANGNASQLSFGNAGAPDVCSIELDTQGQPVAPTLFTSVILPWRIDQATNELVLERTQDRTDPANPHFNNCDPATNSSCILGDQRRVRRLSVSGEREFWLESRRIPCQVVNGQFCGTTPIEDAPADHVVRFYDKQAAGTFAPAKAAMLGKAWRPPLRPSLPRDGLTK